MRIHVHLAHGVSEDTCQEQHCIPHRKFSLTVIEQVSYKMSGDFRIKLVVKAGAPFYAISFKLLIEPRLFISLMYVHYIHCVCSPIAVFVTSSYITSCFRDIVRRSSRITWWAVAVQARRQRYFGGQTSRKIYVCEFYINVYTL
jgi:hypothetical protein